MRFSLVATFISLSLPLAAPALAEGRTAPSPDRQAVVLNGERLPAWKLERLEVLTCATVHPGSYWLAQDGTWGFNGNATPQGIAWDACFGGRQFGVSDPTGAFAAIPGGNPLPPIPGKLSISGSIAYADGLH